MIAIPDLASVIAIIAVPDSVSVILLLVSGIGMLLGVTPPVLRYWKSSRKHEETLLKRQQRRYRESLEAQREQNSHLLLDGNSVTFRGLFYINEFLKRRCPPRREHYLKQLRHYRLAILNWSDERAADNARISLSAYKRIEGLKFKERPQKETIAHICAAFEAEADQLGFDQFYPEHELTTINLRAKHLRLAWNDGRTTVTSPTPVKDVKVG